MANVGFNTSFSDMTGALGDIFGSSSSMEGSGSGTSTEDSDIRTAGRRTRQVEIDQEALTKIVSDILSSEQGLASIFSQEKGAGLFNTTVSAGAAGDLTAKIAGEIAKLTAKEVEEEGTSTVGTRSGTTTSITEQSGGSGGLLGTIGDTLGGLF